jgi:hypothetical protein
LASKKNPPKEIVSKAPVVEAQGKPLVEMKVKHRKKNVHLLGLSLEKHQAVFSVNDIRINCCLIFEPAGIF